MANVENLGWRDEFISRQHRTWGEGCPTCDLDMLGYNWGKSCYLAEFKFHKALKGFKEDSWNLKALCDLAERADLPFMIIFYWREPVQFVVRPMNSAARKYFQPWHVLTERQLASKLYEMRGTKLPSRIAVTLNNQLSDFLSAKKEQQRAKRLSRLSA